MYHYYIYFIIYTYYMLNISFFECACQLSVFENSDIPQRTNFFWVEKHETKIQRTPVILCMGKLIKHGIVETQVTSHRVFAISWNYRRFLKLKPDFSNQTYQIIMITYVYAKVCTYKYIYISCD